MTLDRKRGLVDRVASSRVFRDSGAPARLLKYLADQTLNGTADSLKEYTIAIELLHRRPDFDPRLDSVVRVQMSRLRDKLREYYKTEGQQDRYRIEVPKASYSIRFTKNHANPSATNGKPGALAASALVDWRNAVIAALAALAIALGTAAIRRDPPEPTPSAPVVDAFWKPFLQDPEGPLVIYSNQKFVGTSRTGLRYFDPQHDSESDAVDHYTGVGEVYAVFRLCEYFRSINRRFRLQRASLIAWDQARNSDIIFIGSADENPPVARIQSLQRFRFKFRPGRRRIINLDPQAGEPSAFNAPAHSAAALDYAWMWFGPGLTSGKSILVLAGITTLGTQAAAEFVTRPERLQKLLAELDTPEGERMEPFEAVLEVDISGGVPVDSRIVAIHQP